MPGRAGRYLPAFCFVFILCVLIAGVSFAQGLYSATLSVPDTSQFPHLTAYLDVHDPTGAFLHGLAAQDVVLQENQLQVPTSELQELQPGVQFVIAITPGESFTIRDGLGISRYEYLRQGLLAGAWIGQPAGGDDFSLITLGGPQLIHSDDPAELRSSLEAYLPTDPPATPTLEVLASALQVASDPLDRPGMERAILFITPPQPDEVSLGLQSIITRAIQQNIRIYVWLVAAQESFDLPAINLLRDLAVQTQAGFFAFSHDEPVPDLETILEPLRYVYRLRYDSQVTHPGSQQVLAQISTADQVLTTQVEAFDIDLQAPVVTVLNIPVEIVRSFPNLPTEAGPGANAPLVPGVEVINIRVEFPDGYEHSLTRTSLYVDGAIVAENTQPPFGQLAWDLSPYNQDGVHSVSVEAVDALGLSGKSAPVSIKITLPSATQGVLEELSRHRLVILGILGLIAASILVLLLILGGRIRPRPYPGQVKSLPNAGGKLHPVAIPSRVSPASTVDSPRAVSALLANKRARFSLKGLLAWLPWLNSRNKASPALAQLVPLAGPDEISIPSPLQIIVDESTLGSDSLQASLVIADPSIEGLHARLQLEGKSFHLTDAGTVAGTWVNFDLIPMEGVHLEHADIIHLGRVGFRFVLTEPERVRKIIITPQEPEH
ncbi:MAG: FHA domain-containing protein [Acidobacteriaceae bacterium]